jgi:hypothetical protein
MTRMVIDGVLAPQHLGSSLATAGVRVASVECRLVGISALDGGARWRCPDEPGHPVKTSWVQFTSGGLGSGRSSGGPDGPTSAASIQK